MATAPKAKKKLGPFTALGWAGIGGGTLLVFYLYKRMRASSGSTAQSSNLAGGTSIPMGNSSTSGTGTAAPVFSNWTEWETAAMSALAGANYSPTQALNDLQAWVNGSCVSPAGYNAIGGIITTLGPPPGFGTGLPSLTACAASAAAPNPPAPSSSGLTPAQQLQAAWDAFHPAAPSTGPPALPAQLSSAMQANGESIVSTVWDRGAQDWLYLTNKGGVYNLSPTGGQGSGAYGSYLGLPATATQVPTGAPQRTFSSVTTDQAGGYTLTATDGATYHFGP